VANISQELIKLGCYIIEGSISVLEIYGRLEIILMSADHVQYFRGCLAHHFSSEISWKRESSGRKVPNMLRIK
jgi:hypothetical protein